MKDGEFTKQNRVSLETVRESTAVVDEGKFDEFLNSPTAHPLYSDRWEITLSANLRTYPTESGPKIIPSFHFSRASPVGQVKKKHTPLAEIIQKTGKQPLDAYLDLLSDQIQANI